MSQSGSSGRMNLCNLPRPGRGHHTQEKTKSTAASVGSGNSNPCSSKSDPGPGPPTATPVRLNSGSTKNYPVKASQPNKTRSRFSLRRLFYTNPLLSPPFTRSPKINRKKPKRNGGTNDRDRDRDSPFAGSRGLREAPGLDTHSEGSWVTNDRDTYSTSSSMQGAVAAGGSLAGSSNSDMGSGGPMRECSLCLAEYSPDQFPCLRNCHHLFCIVCLQQYVRIEIQEGRVNLKCPQCNEILHPNDIEMLVGEDSSLLYLYESLMLRRVLAADPDTRWCPAPNCTFAVVATGCASCPKISCEREGCDFSFCYHCKAEWHPNQTCDMARAQRQPVRSSSVSFSQDSGLGGGSELKVCPRCSVLIVKMDDGSCNHMTCAVCGSEFCWLCMKEISDLHYLSPSGCTFWGKKPWSRKKKLMWQLGTLVGAPVGIALIAGISIPAMIIGIPVWVGRKIHSRYQTTGKHRRNIAITGGVTASIFVSPLIAGLAVSIGVPILLAYVYGVVPISLCRSGGCGVHTTTQVLLGRWDYGANAFLGIQGVKIDVDEEVPYTKAATEVSSSRVANPSIGEVSLGASLSLGSGSHLDRVGCVLAECDRESASNTAIAGHSLTGSVASSYIGHQRLEVGADVHPRKKYSFSSERLSETVSLSEKSGSVSLAEDGASTRALAGSLLAYKMENTSVSSYRAGIQTPGSCGSASQGTAGDVDSAIYPCGYSGDEISLRSMPGLAMHHPRSLSPVSSMSGEELTAAVRRSRRRQGFLDKQLSCDSSLVEGQELGDKGSYSEEQTALDRVRFDDNVSFIEANSPDSDLDKPRTIKKTELESTTLREETAEELAMVVSPQPRRPTPSLNVEHVPSIEVVTPWSLAEESLSPMGSPWASQGLSPTSDNCDETPLLHVSTPTSDAETESHNVSNITVMTDTTEASNVTSISIEHDSSTFFSQEHDNKAMIPNDNVAFVSLEGNKSESVKIKIGGNEEDLNKTLTESFCEAL
eukprot:TRINITY_DN27570_c0_g1_i1.p1 TRINITY_DN27570_c0_g1~~TRINITY_DN27570_c0_g1_i1.p1  ORF type:complete len:987 (-),score=234.47 TRINITY_DN27570_c0_g1_i1:914-3874(-)